MTNWKHTQQQSSPFLCPTRYQMGAALLQKNISTMGSIPHCQQQLHNQWRHLLHQLNHHGVAIHTRLLEAPQHCPTPPNGQSARDATTMSTSTTDTRHGMQRSSTSTHSPTTPARKPDDETHPPTMQMGPKRKSTPRLIPHHCAQMHHTAHTRHPSLLPCQASQ